MNALQEKLNEQHVSAAKEKEEYIKANESLENELRLKLSDIEGQEEHIGQLENKIMQLQEMSDQAAFREMEQVVAGLRKQLAKRDKEHVKHTKAITELKKVILEYSQSNPLPKFNNSLHDESVIPSLERKIEKYNFH